MHEETLRTWTHLVKYRPKWAPPLPGPVATHNTSSHLYQFNHRLILILIQLSSACLHLSTWRLPYCPGPKRQSHHKTPTNFTGEWVEESAQRKTHDDHAGPKSIEFFASSLHPFNNIGESTLRQLPATSALWNPKRKGSQHPLPLAAVGRQHGLGDC